MVLQGDNQQGKNSQPSPRLIFSMSLPRYVVSLASFFLSSNSDQRSTVAIDYIVMGD